jgi:hypothetical protein
MYSCSKIFFEHDFLLTINLGGSHTLAFTIKVLVVLVMLEVGVGLHVLHNQRC